MWLEDPRFDVHLNRGLKSGDSTTNSVALWLTRLPRPPKPYVDIVDDCIRCQVGREIEPLAPNPGIGRPRMLFGAVFQIYMYCEARTSSFGESMVSNTVPRRWGFSGPDTGQTYNRSVAFSLAVAIGLDVDARGLDEHDTKEVVIHNLTLAVRTGSEFGLRAATLFAYLGGLTHYVLADLPQLKAEVKKSAGIDLEACVAMYNTCAIERVSASFLESLLDDGLQEIARTDRYSRCENPSPSENSSLSIPILGREWRYGIGVAKEAEAYIIKYRGVSGLRVYPSKFARNLAVLLGLGVTVPGLDSMLEMDKMEKWPVDSLYCGSGVGYYKFRDTESRCVAPNDKLRCVKESRKIRVDSGMRLQVQGRWYQFLAALLTIAVVAGAILAIVLIGPADTAAYGTLLGAVFLAIVAALSDQGGWGLIILDGYRKVGNGVGRWCIGNDTHDVVVQCYRAGICPYSTNTCWYDGASAGPAGIPCDGLLVSRLNTDAELGHIEYSRGLLANVRGHESEATPRLFMVEGVEDGYAYGSFRRTTAWPFDTPVIAIGGRAIK
ncbi:hypothetical protein MHU86_10294 [Fragilaria crotonensis]|nr:hypothetical protein MHU86_10294 [Fragilaria crotonensis]